MSFLHDIWNPWHGCIKCSEGCQNCYMYFLDRMRNQNGAEIYKTKSGFSYPLQKDRTGHYKIQSGEQIRVCMTSDFFLEEADPWRVEAWDIMRQRSDVVPSAPAFTALAASSALPILAASITFLPSLVTVCLSIYFLSSLTLSS